MHLRSNLPAAPTAHLVTPMEAIALVATTLTVETTQVATEEVEDAAVMTLGETEDLVEVRETGETWAAVVVVATEATRTDLPVRPWEGTDPPTVTATEVEKGRTGVTQEAEAAGETPSEATEGTRSATVAMALGVEAVEVTPSRVVAAEAASKAKTTDRNPRRMGEAEAADVAWEVHPSLQTGQATTEVRQVVLRAAIEAATTATVSVTMPTTWVRGRVAVWAEAFPVAALTVPTRVVRSVRTEPTGPAATTQDLVATEVVAAVVATQWAPWGEDLPGRVVAEAVLPAETPTGAELTESNLTCSVTLEA